jgi:hypothetical protein
MQSSEEPADGVIIDDERVAGTRDDVPLVGGGQLLIKNLVGPGPAGAAIR